MFTLINLGSAKSRYINKLNLIECNVKKIPKLNF
jgi:hypothetical protein